MDVINDDAKGEFRRIEVLTGPARRRRWSAAEKGRIVVETLCAGATVTAVARRWQICPQQIWGWRREARTGHLALPAGVDGATPAASFVPIVSEASPLAEPAERTVTPAASVSLIEVEFAGVVVRLMARVDAELLTTVLRCIRASAA
jgi:transposase